MLSCRPTFKGWLTDVLHHTCLGLDMIGALPVARWRQRQVGMVRANNFCKWADNECWQPLLCVVPCASEPEACADAIMLCLQLRAGGPAKAAAGLVGMVEAVVAAAEEQRNGVRGGGRCGCEGGFSD